jgi:hypothetical protein
MKRYNYFLISAIALVFILSGFTRFNGSLLQKKIINREIPENVNTILQKSCSGCHSTLSTNDKAKDKLNLNEWNNYSNTALASKLGDIDKTVSEGEMPPKRFLERFPDKKLTTEEVKILHDWAKKESKILSK